MNDRKLRRKITGEDFTPDELVNNLLSFISEEDFKNSAKKFLDPTGGNGQIFISLYNKLIQYHSFETIMHMIYTVDIIPDNCIEIIQRLYKKEVSIVPFDETPKNFITDGFISMFSVDNKLITNIICADGLIYDYSFGNSEKNEIFDNYEYNKSYAIAMMNKKYNVDKKPDNLTTFEDIFK
jgi:hypothetical protein